MEIRFSAQDCICSIFANFSLGSPSGHLLRFPYHQLRMYNEFCTCSVAEQGGMAISYSMLTDCVKLLEEWLGLAGHLATA